MTDDSRDATLCLSTLFGAGYVGLRALATGLPASLLLNPRRRSPIPGRCRAPRRARPQFIIFNTSGNGDPINASVPGTYEDPNIVHSPDPTMAPQAAHDPGTAAHGGGAVGDASARPSSTAPCSGT